MLPRTRLALTPILIAVVSLTAVACGLKGPLYRPDEARNESVAPASPAPKSDETSTESPKKKDTSSTPSGEQSEPGVAPPDPDRPVVPPPGR